MTFFSRSWIWIAVLAAILAMHMFGHGGHGGHAGHGVESSNGQSGKPVGKDGAQHPPQQPPEHRH